jgi:hypothetical protein
LCKMYYLIKNKKMQNVAKTDEKRWKQWLQSQTLFLGFKENTNTASVAGSVLDLTTRNHGVS